MNNKNLTNAFLVTLCCLLSFSVLADGIAINYGESTSKDKSPTRRASYVMVFDQLNQKLENSISIEAEASYFIFKNYYGDDLTGGSLTPMIRYFFPLESMNLYAGFGIGVAYIDQKSWGNRDLGDNWMFEDKLEIGNMFNQHSRLALSLMHYSNAGTNKYNDGTNIFFLGYSYLW